MRQVIWVQGAMPEGFTPTKMYATAKLLANSVGGELVKFGENSHIIIGDERAKARIEVIRAQKPDNQ